MSTSLSSQRHMRLQIIRRNLRLLLLCLFATGIFTNVVLAQSATELVSFSSAGTSTGNAQSKGPAISADGRFIAFESIAGNLTATSDTNGASDIFVRDMQSGITTLLSLNVSGTSSAGGNSTNASISRDGRYVAFVSTAPDLTSHSDTNNNLDVFVRDTHTGVTYMASVNVAGTASGNYSASNHVLSGNGKVVVFLSPSTDLSPNDTNMVTDVFARDFEAGITRLVSINRFGTNGGNGDSFSNGRPDISHDGRFVAFESKANDLTANDTNSISTFGMDVFVRDLQQGTTQLASINAGGNGSSNRGTFASGLRISGNGRFLAFSTSSTNLVEGIGYADGYDNVFVRDLSEQKTHLASINMQGTAAGNGGSARDPFISYDGRYVTFRSDDFDLAPNDRNNGIGSLSDVFVRDLQAGTTTLVSMNYLGTDSGNSSSGSFAPSPISDDGRFVLFVSGATNLIAHDDFNNSSELLVRDTRTSTTRLITVNRFDSAAGTGQNAGYALSADGVFVAFAHPSSILVTQPDTNRAEDVFRHAVLRPGQLQLSSSRYRTDENAGGVTVTVTRADDTTAATVNYVTGEGTAQAGADYATTSGTLEFAVGESFKTLTISLVNDSLREENETFNLILNDPSGAALGVPTNAVLTIVDDEPADVFVSDASLVEGDDGIKYIRFTVNSSSTNRYPTIRYTTADGTAQAGSDYQQATGTIIFYNKTQDIYIPVNGDRTPERDETFFLNISNPTNAVISDDKAIGTITNDDPLPTLLPVADSYVVGAEALRDTNYGAAVDMQVKRTLNPGSGRGRRGFLRFETAEFVGDIARVRLRIFARLTDASLPPTFMIVQKVPNTTWDELAVTWNNQPSVESFNPLAQITVTGATGQYYEFDLTSFIQAERAAGRTAVSLRLINRQATGNSGAFFTSINSKEAEANRPQLVIEQ